MANIAASLPCRDCATGTLHEGTPKGRVETLHGLPTYIAEPPSGTPKGVIVIIPDAFGWELPNNRVLADNYAEKGNFRVYLPDFMDGHWLEHDLLKSLNRVTNPAPSYWGAAMKIFPGLRSFAGFAPFVFFNRISVTKPRVYKFFHDLRAAEASTLPVGTAGFCWGGKFVTLLCADSEKTAGGKRLVDVGFTAHPSMLDVPADIEAVTLPLSVCIGDVDFGLPMARVRQIQEIFERKNREGPGGRFEIVVLEGARHGFAVRGNPKVKEEMEQGIVAEDQAIRWLGKWCDGS